jgi:hypothetical protein
MLQGYRLALEWDPEKFCGTEYVIIRPPTVVDRRLGLRIIRPEHPREPQALMARKIAVSITTPNPEKIAEKNALKKKTIQKGMGLLCLK